MSVTRPNPAHRSGEVALLLDTLTSWASRQDDIAAVALVGSYARGEPTEGSDVDVVLLTSDPDRYLKGEGWQGEVARGGRVIRRQSWGPVTERRLLLPTGLQLDLGITTPQWAATPLDPGTRRVLSDGARALYDPHGLLRAAISASGQAKGR